MIALTFFLTAAAQDRIQYRPLAGDLSIDGRQHAGTRKDLAEHVDAMLASCPEAAPVEKKRRLTYGVGQGLSSGGILAMAVVTATNPYAVGPVLALATVSLSGSGMMLMNMTPRKSLDVYEAHCMGEPDAEEPDELYDEEPPLDL